MCATSAVSDHYFRQHPDWFRDYTPLPGITDPYRIPAPTPQPIVINQGPDEETKALLREIVKRLDALDKRMNEKDCMDDKKAKFFKLIEYVPEKE